MKPTLLSLLLLFCGTATLCAQGAEIDIQNPDTLTICRGDIVELQQANNLADANLRWSPADGFLDPVTDPSPRVQPRFSQYYRVQVSDGDQFAIDSIYIDVDSLLVPRLINDTTVCQGDPLLLITEEVDDPFQTIFAFSPGDNFEDSTDVNSRLLVDTNIVISLVSTAENNVCRDSQSVSITITPARLEFLEDTISICTETPDTVDLNIRSSSGVPDDFRFFPLDGIVGELGTTRLASPEQTTLYRISGTVNGCFRQDSVLVTIDSLPEDMSMMLDPVKDPYCPGDTVRIISPIYEVADFPFIEHEWLRAPGIVSPMDLYNAFVFAADTAYMLRRTTNGSCVRFDSILMNVVTPVSPEFLPDTAVCAGQPVQITTIFPAGPATLEWMDPNGTLSCTDCLDPVATVGGTTTYQIEVTPEGSECPGMTSYTLQVRPPDRQPTFNQSPVCPGTTIQLISGGIEEGFRYRIVGPGVDSDDPNVRVTIDAATTFTVTTTGICETNTAEVTVPVIPNPTVTASGPDEVCAGENFTLTASADQGGGTFVWTTPDGPRSGASISVSQDAATLYTVTYTNDCDSTATATVNVGVAATPVVTLDGPAIICPGDPVTLTATSSEDFADGVFVIEFGGAIVGESATATFTPGASGTATVTYIGRCETVTSTSEVSIFDLVVEPLIAATFANGSPIDSAVFSGNQVTLSVANLPGVITNYSYSWTGNFEPMSASGETITVTVPDGQDVGDLNYSVEVTVDETGCSYFASIFLPVIESSFKAPEVFTPNSDGRNDIFRIFFNGEITDYSLVVFNRWGNKVYASSDPTESWDGSRDGKPQSPDVYYYIAQFTQNGVAREADGEVMLVR